MPQDGRTPLDLATAGRQDEVVRILKAARPRLEAPLPPAAVDVCAPLQRRDAAQAHLLELERRVGQLPAQIKDAAAQEDYHRAAQLKDALASAETELEAARRVLARAEEELKAMRKASAEAARAKRKAAADAARALPCSDLHKDMLDAADELCGKMSGRLPAGDAAARMESRDLKVGNARDAGEGLDSLMRIDDAELDAGLSKGIAAMREEVKSGGTDEDKECLRYVLDEEAGSSSQTFQDGLRCARRLPNSFCARGFRHP